MMNLRLLRNALTQRVSRPQLLDVCSDLLSSGYTKEEILSQFDSFFLANPSLDDDYDDEAMDVVAILEGYHHPSLSVDSSGIRFRH
mgnify:FL=1